MLEVLRDFECVSFKWERLEKEDSEKVLGLIKTVHKL